MQAQILQIAVIVFAAFQAGTSKPEVSLRIDRKSGVAQLRFMNRGSTDLLLCNWPGAYELHVQTPHGLAIPRRDQRFADTVANLMPYDWVVLRRGQAFELELTAMKYGKVYRNIPRSYRVWAEISNVAATFDTPEFVQGHKVRHVRNIGRVWPK